MSKPDDIPQDVRERFDEKCVPEPNSGCLIWLGATDGRYGDLVVRQRHHKAHRFAWEMANGDIPEGLYVLHKCDNTFCVNPGHLFLGTYSDNMRDCSRKRRNAMQRRPHRSRFNSLDIPRPFGEAHGNAVLTVKRVLVIKSLAAEGRSSTSIAREFKVSAGQVRKIVAGKAWRKAIAAAIRKGDQ